MKIKYVRIETENDYFEALEILYNDMDYSAQSYVLFKILIKGCKKFERRKRIAMFNHLQWSN